MNSSAMRRSQIFSKVSHHFSNVSHHFSNVFEYFQTFSIVFERFYFAHLAQSLQINRPDTIFTSKIQLSLLLLSENLRF